MHNTLNTKSFLVCCLLAIPAIGVAQQRVAFGPVETREMSSPNITVLDQTFAFSCATRIAVNGRRVPTAAGINSISTGERVYVEGIDTSDRSLATSIEVVRGQYVPG